MLYDATQRAPYFTDRSGATSHTVWFSDATSAREQFRLARGSGFRGSALWAPGLEEPATWPTLRTAVRAAVAHR